MPPGQDDEQLIVSLDGVSAAYGRRLVLRDVSFVVHEGDRLGLVGPNGGGKTTMLRLILGLLKPREGRLTRPDEELRYGYVPQRGKLDPAWPLSVLEVTAMGLYAEVGLFRRPTASHLARAESALVDVGLGDRAGARYADLSGGQKQRVLVARALAVDPQVLVLDEPTSGLDLPTKSAFGQLVDDLVAQRGMTVLWACHDLNTVARHIDRVALVRQELVMVGATTDLLTAQRLSQVYDAEVLVKEVDGQRIIIGATGAERGGGPR